ncbi:hypothetical protein CPAST_c11430 [Clostridium pasteurianum DSM 525 = ATCC 6013]|uniref:Uncharacterized protein n=1 Tax=Clostridium pasteurianum DSM 525 = ATCC 6013 TaxID=1262449 RepID=A0A0H3J5R4_CLOPA|nr:hypothetical protein [Clostridium pasteurianum]AJA47243.1 hypothetical protein CPAST_c11430 [Clostridium pasteurianum DSM 525 = ATCC 6013]AJA51231.1 hypothetical protein CLPA_c11430 [Clostridium pasteurianum DSM 525 = ATCC 6013]KRU12761.1 hypothetical protein CP6013_02009 [Clostridium pasteurianum DSM 525 = ATCC 6013]UZW15423.1 hypothetical protein OSC52_06185 [Clostridium pasteurianum]
MNNKNTAMDNVLDENNQKKESKKDMAYKVAAGIANAILVMLGIGLLRF